MTKYFFNIIIHLCILNGVSAQCTFENFYRYFEPDYLTHKMLRLSDGGYLNYGTAVKDTVDFGLTETDMVLIKTDSCGRLIWINDEGYLADGDPSKYAIEMDSGNIMIVGYTAAYANIWVGKYSESGQLLKEIRIKGNRITTPNGVVKNSYKTNSYYISGVTQASLIADTKPFLVEIDDNLNIVKWKELSDTSFTKAYNKSNSLYKLMQKNALISYAIIGAGASDFDTIYLTEIDTSFNVIRSRKLINDTINIYHGFRIFFLENNKQNFVGYMELSMQSGGGRKNALVKMDLEGNMHTVSYLPDTGIGTITCINPTLDGGYILGPRFIKVDSNLNIEWIKPMHGQLNSVVQLPDGGYVGGGLSDARTQSWGEGFYEMYLVRTDKDGKYIRSGISETGKGNTPQVLIYPNPANTHFTIYTSLPYHTLQVYSLTGNKVFQQNYCSANTDINIADVAQGLYILQLVDESGAILHTQKLSIQH